jgi:hypothetical protein
MNKLWNIMAVAMKIPGEAKKIPRGAKNEIRRNRI